MISVYSWAIWDRQLVLRNIVAVRRFGFHDREFHNLVCALSHSANGGVHRYGRSVHVWYNVMLRIY